MPTDLAARGGQGSKTRPVSGIATATAEPIGQLIKGVLHLGGRSARHTMFEQGRRRLAERAGADGLAQRDDAFLLIQHHFGGDGGTASRRAKFGPPIGALERPGFAKRCREPQDFGGVDGRVHCGALTRPSLAWGGVAR